MPFLQPESIPALALRLEALTAVNRTVSAGLEGHLRFCSATIADYGEHLTGSSIAVLGTASCSAGRAAAGLILEAFLGEEFLLTRRENEFVAAVTAGQSLVFVHLG